MIGNGLMCNSYEVGDSVLKYFALLVLIFCREGKTERRRTHLKDRKRQILFNNWFIVHHWIMQDYRFSSRANNSQPVRFTSSRSIPSRSSQSAPHQLVNHETFSFFPFEIYWLAGSRRISDWIPITLLPHGQVSLGTAPVTNPIQKIPKSCIWIL